MSGTPTELCKCAGGRARGAFFTHELLGTTAGFPVDGAPSFLPEPGLTSSSSNTCLRGSGERDVLPGPAQQPWRTLAVLALSDRRGPEKWAHAAACFRTSQSGSELLPD